ncbi:two-component sensor histidine kinase [Streptomyces sp. WAC 06738]|uniref:sensor histidine kinase n=1 Tax=Streptomyces sp. WAC 06738 TaxID=2203210 RepID=UPI000F6E1DF3|nr:histidine kinase [Streptomyces sp. WAC 06738]AZM47639.1 two-component sensor histidine kinase [Streptomyces sp. WAC 06738]
MDRRGRVGRAAVVPVGAARVRGVRAAARPPGGGGRTVRPYAAITPSGNAGAAGARGAEGTYEMTEPDAGAGAGRDPVPDRIPAPGRGGGALRWLRRARRMSGPERWRSYTLSTIYFLALVEAALLGVWLNNTRDDMGAVPFAVVVVLLLAHLTMQVKLSLSAPFLGAAGPTRRLLVVYLVAVSALLTAALALRAAERLDPSELGPFLVWVLMFAAGPLVLALPLRRGALAVAALCAATLLAALAIGPRGAPLAITAVTTAVCAPFMGFTFRVSAWGLQLVDELVAARAVQARLAVAEERLRFGRDLHDVLGRNLAVMALKSELAVQLAQRGRPEAADQMAEVQRVAQESQREIRAVVRGYRAADLHAELAGARAVLRAAGVDCEVDDADLTAPGRRGEVPERVQSALAWVVREGTTNVLRHADARMCTVSMRVADGGAELVMDNDGAPDAEPGTPADGAGLTGLRERLAAVGGTLSAQRRTGGRFRLAARIDLEAS